MKSCCLTKSRKKHCNCDPVFLRCCISNFKQSNCGSSKQSRLARWREQSGAGLRSAWRPARPPAPRPEWEAGGRSGHARAGGETGWLPIKNIVKWAELKKSNLQQQPTHHPHIFFWIKTETNDYSLYELVWLFSWWNNKICPTQVPRANGDVFKWLVFIQYRVEYCPRRRGEEGTQMQENPINSSRMRGYHLNPLQWGVSLLYCTTVSFPLWTAGSWGACRQAHTWDTSNRKYLGWVETGCDVLPLYYIQHSFPTFVPPTVSRLMSSLPVLLNNLAVSSKTPNVSHSSL